MCVGVWEGGVGAIHLVMVWATPAEVAAAKKPSSLVPGIRFQVHFHFLLHQVSWKGLCNKYLLGPFPCNSTSTI